MVLQFLLILECKKTRRRSSHSAQSHAVRLIVQVNRKSCSFIPGNDTRVLTHFCCRWRCNICPPSKKMTSIPRRVELISAEVQPRQCLIYRLLPRRMKDEKPYQNIINHTFALPLLCCVVLWIDDSFSESVASESGGSRRKRRALEFVYFSIPPMESTTRR